MLLVYLVPSWKMLAHLNAAGNGDGVAAALGTDAALLDFGQVNIGRLGAVPSHVQAGVVVLLTVCAAGEVAGSLKGAVEEDGSIAGHLQIAGANIPGLETAFLGDDSGGEPLRPGSW